MLAEDDEYSDPDVLHELLYPSRVSLPHHPPALFPRGAAMPTPPPLMRTWPRRVVRSDPGTSGRLVSSLLLAQHKATRDTYVGSAGRESVGGEDAQKAGGL